MTFEPSASCGLGAPPHLGQTRKGRRRLLGAAAGRAALQAAGRWLGCPGLVGLHSTGCRPVIAPRRQYGCWAGWAALGAPGAAVDGSAARSSSCGAPWGLWMGGWGADDAQLAPQCGRAAPGAVDALARRGSSACWGGQQPAAGLDRNSRRMCRECTPSATALQALPRWLAGRGRPQAATASPAPSCPATRDPANGGCNAPAPRRLRAAAAAAGRRRGGVATRRASCRRFLEQRLPTGRKLTCHMLPSVVAVM